MHGLGGEVHVLAVENLCHDPPLRGEPEIAVAKPDQEIADNGDLTCSSYLSACNRWAQARVVATA